MNDFFIKVIDNILLKYRIYLYMFFIFVFLFNVYVLHKTLQNRDNNTEINMK